MKSCQPDFPDLFAWWDATKLQFKATAIQYCVRKRKRQSLLEDSLQQRLTTEKQKINPDLELVRTIDEQLNSVITDRLKGAPIRSRAQWMEEGEKPTSYFFKLERSKQSTACITKLETTTGIVTSNQDILDTARSFYQSLYGYEPADEDCQQWLLEQLDTQLDDNNRSMCEGPITREETNTALAHMHANKLPGPDGLTTEFYRTFWTVIAPDLIELYNLAFEYNVLSPSQKESILRLLFKKGNRHWLKNWRPISLLNCNYKILATTLYLRMRPPYHW